MVNEDEEEAAEGEAEAAEVAPAGSKRKTRTPHSDVGNNNGLKHRWPFNHARRGQTQKVHMCGQTVRLQESKHIHQGPKGITTKNTS